MRVDKLLIYGGITDLIFRQPRVLWWFSRYTTDKDSSRTDSRGGEVSPRTVPAIAAAAHHDEGTSPKDAEEREAWYGREGQSSEEAVTVSEEEVTVAVPHHADAVRLEGENEAGG